ncbi:MAG: hypothetical protein GC149_16885 [Gammaproteobacteria bacterium]|nr:hypothetical protein [Gammaproteobacteria bacterium]
MANKKKPIYSLIGSMMVVVMLFSQSVSVWANMGAAPMLQQPVALQKACDTTMSAHSVSTRHHHCHKNCCGHNKTCSTGCSLHCLVTGLSMLPTTITSVAPFFAIQSINQTEISPQHSAEISLFERPPKQFA